VAVKAGDWQFVQKDALVIEPLIYLTPNWQQPLDKKQAFPEESKVQGPTVTYWYQ
jgi:hypothetical protein